MESSASRTANDGGAVVGNRARRAGRHVPPGAPRAVARSRPLERRTRGCSNGQQVDNKRISGTKCALFVL
jgi:hypothetical protein